MTRMPRGKAAELYRETHWGVPARTRYQIDDPRLPARLVEMGRLREIHLEDGRQIGFAEDVLALLAFSPDEATRLYCVLPRDARREAKRRLLRAGAAWAPMALIAGRVGGRQSEYPYPIEYVQEVGTVAAIVYATWKLGDDDDRGGCEYIHAFGDRAEGTGERPVLGIARDGSLWIIGGAYCVRPEGITG